MSEKPSVASGYNPNQLGACRRLLVEFFRGLGPWREGVYLVGGLAPSIREPNPPGGTPPHLGTQDIDLVLDMDLLEQGVDAYASLRQNIRRMGLVPGRNDAGNTQNYRWERTGTDEQAVSIDLLCDVPGRPPASAITLPGEGQLSALVIPASNLVIRDYVERRVVVEDRVRDVVLDENIRVAGIAVSIVLKAYALEHRRVHKDMYDIVWSLRSHPAGPAGAGRAFAEQAAAEKGTAHHATALTILRRRFVSEEGLPAVRKDDPAMYAEFMSEEHVGDENRRRRQEAVVIVGQFLASVDQVMRQSQ